MAWVKMINGVHFSVKTSLSACSLAALPAMRELDSLATSAGLTLYCSMDMEEEKVDVLLGRDLNPTWCLYPGQTGKINHEDIGKYEERITPLAEKLKKFLDVQVIVISCHKGVFMNASN